LNNRFELVGGFKQYSTNSTHTTYKSQGGLLSLGDYSLEDDVMTCISESCDNQLNLTLTIAKATKEKQLQIVNNFLGKSVNYEQAITDITIYL
jgi:hypothetical protein